MTFTKLRPFQRQVVDAVLEKAQKPLSPDDPYGYPRVIINAAPGSGKSPAVLAAGDALKESGFITTMVHLSPRLNLARQMEGDSKAFVNSPLRRVLRWILHRINERPLLRTRDTDGYSTTYASLTRNLKLHCDELKGVDFVLVVDELQTCGVTINEGQDEQDAASDSATTDAVRELARMAKIVIGMTGTAFRADDKPLLFADYTEKDEKGERKLIADVTATYRTGVAEGYLRKFQCHMFDGGVYLNELGELREVSLRNIRRALRRILEHEDFWKPMIDRFMEICTQQRALVSPLLRDLIACTGQKQARLIQAYLKQKYGIVALLAISDDGEEAHKALELFKSGDYQVLITVNMAYIGYDFPAISHICLLSSFRTMGFLFQLVARGLRVMKEIPFEDQTCFVIAPVDPNMQEFIDWMQVESDIGLSERKQKEQQPPKPDEIEHEEQPILSFVDSGFFGEEVARGYHMEGDLAGTELQWFEEKRVKFGIATPSTTLAALVRDMKHEETHPKPPPPFPSAVKATPFKTERDLELEARSDLDKEVHLFAKEKAGGGRDIDGRLAMSIWTALENRDGKKNPQRNLDELNVCLKRIRDWRRIGMIHD